jgi:hypothetical protein
MYKLHFHKSDFISPMNPSLRIEVAIDCDGSECGSAIHDESGQLEDLSPHFHLIESEIGAWTRKYAVG